MLDGFARYSVYLNYYFVPLWVIESNGKEQKLSWLNQEREGRSDEWWGAFYFWRFCYPPSLQKPQVWFPLSNQSKWGLAKAEEGTVAFHSLRPLLRVPCTSRCKEGPNPILSTHLLTMNKYSLVTIWDQHECTECFAWRHLHWEKSPKKQLPIGSIIASILTMKETEAQGYWAVCPEVMGWAVRRLLEGERYLEGVPRLEEQILRGFTILTATSWTGKTASSFPFTFLA